jgi:hypothetical protein
MFVITQSFERCMAQQIRIVSRDCCLDSRRLTLSAGRALKWPARAPGTFDSSYRS